MAQLRVWLAKRSSQEAAEAQRRNLERREKRALRRVLGDSPPPLPDKSAFPFPEGMVERARLFIEQTAGGSEIRFERYVRVCFEAFLRRLKLMEQPENDGPGSS